MEHNMKIHTITDEGIEKAATEIIEELRLGCVYDPSLARIIRSHCRKVDVGTLALAIDDYYEQCALRDKQPDKGTVIDMIREYLGGEK